MADLGRFEEAMRELAPVLAADPADAAGQTLAARLWLTMGNLREALAAADAAVAAARTDVAANVARGMTLAELGRRDEAVAQAEQILRLGRGDGAACTSAAAILAQVGNGQLALDAAWEGARLTPDRPRAHLVLGVVAARLGQDDVAARAYQEALVLDPKLAEQSVGPGLAQLEQHQYAAELSRFVAPEPSEADVPAAAAAAEVRKILRYAAGYAMIAAVLVACVAAADLARLAALLLGGVGLVVLAVSYRRLPIGVRRQLLELIRSDRSLEVAIWATVAAPALLVLLALIGRPWPVVASFVASSVALIVLRRAPAAEE